MCTKIRRIIIKYSLPYVNSVLHFGKYIYKSFTSTTTDPINEIAMLGLLVSIVFIALSQEKDEDEMAPVERQRAFIWSFWITAILYTIGILFTFGMQFLYCTFAMPYIFFILYIIRFNLAMHKLRRELK